jgi:uncharacterized membrane protein
LRAVSYPMPDVAPVMTTNRSRKGSGLLSGFLRMFRIIALILDHLYLDQYFFTPAFMKRPSCIFPIEASILFVHLKKRNNPYSLTLVLSHNLWFNITMKKHPAAKIILFFFLAVMAGMIVLAIVSKESFMALMNQPVLIKHARFVHIAAVTLFFSNAVVGMLWERRALASGNKDIILHTYNTVTLLDSTLSSPLIVLSLLGGLSLSFQQGDLFQIGWLSVSFLFFILSGIIWVISDIPTQYKMKRLLASIGEKDQTLPPELIRVMKLRWWIGITGTLPLAAAFALMVYKPDILAAAEWFK